MPGAEGAPLAVALSVFVLEVEWLDGGAMRRDCGGQRSDEVASFEERYD